MALTITKVADTEQSLGRLKMVVVDITFDSSYPAGGEAISASEAFMRRIIGVKPVGGNAAAGALGCHWDTTNNKLMLFYPTGGATASPAAIGDPKAVANTAGADTITADPVPITPGQGKELLATTDASSITVRCLVFGEGA